MTRPPRLLLLAAEFPPYGGGGVIRVTKLVKYLSRLGWSITVASCDEPAPVLLDTRLAAEVPPSVVVHRIRGPLRFIGAVAPAVRGDIASSGLRASVVGLAKALVKTMAIPDRWVGWAIRAAFQSRATLGDPDIVVSSGPPHSVHLAGRMLSRRLRVPHVMDLRDDWAGNPVYRSSAPWRAPLDRWLERRCVNGAARVVVIAEASHARYRGRYPTRSDDIQLIQNGFDPEDFGGPGSTHMSRPIEFLHAGSLHGRADGGSFFEAFGEAIIDPSMANVRLHLLGPVSGPQQALARRFIPNPRLVFEAPVAHEQAIERMRAAGVLVLIANTLEAGRGTLTGKVFEYLAARRPILVAAPAGEAQELVREAGAGFGADPRDRAAMISSIRDAAKLATDPAFSGGATDVINRYDRAAQASRWDSMLRGVIGSARR